MELLPSGGLKQAGVNTRCTFLLKHHKIQNSTKQEEKQNPEFKVDKQMLRQTLSGRLYAYKRAVMRSENTSETRTAETNQEQ